MLARQLFPGGVEVRNEGLDKALDLLVRQPQTV
jgi:hypothetical protein